MPDPTITAEDRAAAEEIAEFLDESDVNDINHIKRIIARHCEPERSKLAGLKEAYRRVCEESDTYEHNYAHEINAHADTKKRIAELEQREKLLESSVAQWKASAKHADEESKRRAQTLFELETQLANAKEREKRLVEALRECLRCVDECYEATGHVRVAKTSQQRLKIEQALTEAGYDQ